MARGEEKTYGAPCCIKPCDGSRCHLSCVLSEEPVDECDCHCGGENHSLAIVNPSAALTGEKAKAKWGPLARQLHKVNRSRLAKLSDEELEAKIAKLDWSKKNAVIMYAQEADRRDKAKAGAPAEVVVPKRDREAEKAERNARLEAQKADTKARNESRRRGETLEHHTRLEAAYVRAEDDTNGHMLSKAGQARGIDPKTLWTGNERTARKYASEELNEHWDKHGRLTVGAVKLETRRNRQAEEEAHEAEHGAYSHLTYARMRPQDFDSSVPLSLMDESTVRASQPLPKGRRDAAGTEDMFG